MSSGNTVADFSPKGQPRRFEKLEDFGARERTRTSTTLRSLAPEASASASSATRARVKKVGSGRSQPREAFLILPAAFSFVNARRPPRQGKAQKDQHFLSVTQPKSALARMTFCDS